MVRNSNAILQYSGLLGVLGLLVAFFGVTTNNFFSAATAQSIANQVPHLTLVAVGMTLVLVVGGIDLSVGSLLALASGVTGVLMIRAEMPLWIAGLAGVSASTVCGLLSGLVTQTMRLPSFIVTLGVLEVARGITKLVTDSRTVFVGSEIGFLSDRLPLLRISPIFLFAIVVVVVVHLVLTKTVFGRHLIALGSNAEALRLSGIRTGPYLVSVFAISGLLSGLGGICYAARLSSSDPNAAVGLELLAIAACVIGGTSLAGGRGNVLCTFLGVLIIQVLQTGLAQIGASDPVKQIVTGSVIVLAVTLDALRARWSRMNG
jgi:ribose transport system permease protein